MVRSCQRPPTPSRTGIACAHDRPRPTLLEQARAWAAEDPDEQTRAELEARRRGRRARRGDRPGRPLRRHARVRHGRPARRARRRPQPDEPRRGHPRGGRPGGVPQGHRPRRRVRGHRLRRPPQLRRLRPRHRRDHDRRRPQGARDAPHAAHAPARVRHPRARLRGRRDGHREPQPAAGQRLQGLPRRRQPDRAARRQRDRRPDRRRGRRSPTCRAATPARSSARRSSTATSTPSPGLAEDGPRDLTHRLHPAARRRGHDGRAGAGDRRVRRPLHRRAAGAPRPRLPDRLLPQPRGAGRDGPRDGARGARSGPTWSSPTTPTPTAARSPCPTPTAGGCCAATRSAPCWPATSSPAGATGTYANSIVSSSLLGKMAAAAGQPHEETLTGFKWIGRVEDLAFGYEEALGYCCDPEHVKDKDGVSALLLVCELAAAAKAEGRGLTDLLDDIAHEHGLHATDQLSVRFDDLAADPGHDGAGARHSPDHARRARRRAGRGPLAGLGRSCRPPTACATPSPRAPASSCARAAPSRRSSATSRS